MKIRKVKLSSAIPLICLLVLGIYTLSKSGTYQNPGIQVPELFIPMSGSAASSPDYSFNADISSLPKDAKLYKFIHNNEFENSYNNIKHTFKFTENAVVQNIDDVRFLSEENEAVSKWLDFYFSDGTWQYHDYSKPTAASVKLPSNEASAQLAIAFLKNNNLYNDRFAVSAVVEQYSGSKETDDYNAYCKSVYFYPSIDGMPVYGVSRIVVDIGDNGDIIGVSHFYKDIIESETVGLISPESLYESIERAELSSNINPSAVKATINEIYLGYWEDAGSVEEQPYLQPVWVFTGVAVFDDGQEEPFDVIASAIRGDYVLPKSSEGNNNSEAVPTPNAP